MAAVPDLSRGPALLATTIVTELLALLTCFLRFYVRRRSASHIGLDDYSIVVAGVVGFIGTIFSIIEGSSMVDSAHALEFDWLGQPWFMMGATFAKISICLFFVRIVGSVKQWRILLSSQILLMAILNFAFSLTSNLQCRPLEKLWSPEVLGVCWDPNVQLNIGYFQGAFSVFWWLFLSLFPVMIVRDFEMRQQLRWPFYLLSSLSLIAAIFATVRTYETSQTVPGVFTYDTFFATVLSILEQNIGVIAANMLPVSMLFWATQHQGMQGESLVNAARNGEQPGRTESGDWNPFESGAASITSSRRGGDNESVYAGSDLGDGRQSRSSSKRGSMLIIEGPREADYNMQNSNGNTENGTVMDSSNFNNNSTDTRSEARHDTTFRAILNRSASRMMRSGRDSAASRHSLDEGVPQESFWPRGIIKTVEVEVVEEDITHVPLQDYRPSSSASGAIAMNGNSNHAGAIDSRASLHSRMDSYSNDWAVMLRAGPTPPASRGPSRQGFQ